MIRGGVSAVAAASGLAGVTYYLVVSGKVTIDTGRGAGSARPVRYPDRAPAPTVLNVIAALHLRRTPAPYLASFRYSSAAPTWCWPSTQAGA